MDLKNNTKELHEHLDLYVNNDFFVFQPSDHSACLTVNRSTGVIKLASSNDISFHALSRADRVYGILGLLSLVSSEFIVVIVEKELRGELFGNYVYQATDFKVLPLNPFSPYQHAVESHLLALVRSHLYGATFLFSYTWDLTRTLQAQRLSRERDVGKALWEVADDRFFWNKFLHSRFIDSSKNSQDLSPFILPIIYGTFDICDATIHSHKLKFGLISRRCRHRAGTRYFTRGIDEKGNVANFNETEQIIVSQPSSSSAPIVLSFVQIRGSIPVFWAEINTLRYVPDLQIMELSETLPALRLHLQNQVTQYGALHIVNLVKQKGHEKPIKDAFERYVSQANIPHVSYDYFDFHRECRNMQWHRIGILIERLESDLVEKSYFHDNIGSPAPLKLQRGVVRTNCIDNLDRTNVAQSMLAKWTVTRQLRELGILKPNEELEQFEDFMVKFRKIWADHADSISRAYSGTGALKTDFTRTGKRTNAGALQDGANSMMRYIKNNYFDGARQDAFDIFTGSWVPQTGQLSLQNMLFDDRPLHVRSVPYVLSFSIFMVFAGLTLPRASDYSLVYYFAIWLTLIIFAVAYIFLHSIYYVAWPRLNPLTHVIHYDGPGYRSGRRGSGQTLTTKGAKFPLHSRQKSKIEEVEMGNIKKHID